MSSEEGCDNPDMKETKLDSSTGYEGLQQKDICGSAMDAKDDAGLLYLVAVAGAAVYLALQVVPYRPRNLVSLAGLAFLLLVGLLLSSKPVRIPWHTVFWGVALQFYLGIFVLRTHVGYNIVEWIGHRVEEFIGYTDAGSKFLFGDAYTMHPFVFK
nr:hypothetical protein BaRGS_030868 [Batillaria attramentaria]